MKKTPKPKIVRYTMEQLQRKVERTPSKTDWAKIDAMTDEDIDYSDIPELDEKFWANAKIVHPQQKKPVSLRLDQDIVVWFKKQKGRYQTLMNAVLRQYMNTHKR